MAKMVTFIVLKQKKILNLNWMSINMEETYSILSSGQRIQNHF